MVHYRSFFAVLFAALLCGSGFAVSSSAMAARSAGNHADPVAYSRVHAPGRRLAQVRYIDRGLTVQAPKGKQQKGKVKMPLFNRYVLHTRARQHASIGFRDQTVLHINERTDATLRSPHLTYVAQGEVDEMLVPGTDHRVQSAAAVASAIGTTFDVKVKKTVTTVIVLHGAVQVRNPKGTVLVKSNQQTTVKPNQKPTKPKTVDAAAATSWAASIPSPTLGENLALDANGGAVIQSSSEASASKGAAKNIIDGRLDTGWQTAPGATGDQSIKIAFEGSKLFLVSGVLIDPAATGGASPTTDLKDFEIRFSNSTSSDRDFSTLFRGTAKQSNSLQLFKFTQPIHMRYLELVVKSNYGSTGGTSVAELEAVGTPQTGNVFDFPSGIAVNPQGNIDVVDSGFGVVQRLTPEGALLATLGEPGIDPGHLAASDGLAEDAAGNIYVMNNGHRLVKLSPKGAVLAEWGAPGNGPGQFAAAKGVAVDTQGNVYVADSNNNRIEKFTSTGQFLAQFRGSPKSIGNILGIAVDNAGNMYVSNGAGDLIIKLSPNGTELTRWGTGGRGPGQFLYPVGIALDAQGNVYVADSENNRIEKFTSTGQFITSWATPGVKGGPPIRPLYLAIDAAGNVYVTSAAQGQVVEKFSPTGQLLATWR